MNAPSAKPESEQILSILGNVWTKRKLLLAACVGGMLSLVFVYNRIALPVYESSTTVLFEDAQDPIQTDATQNISWEVYLFNRIEEINSRAFASDILAALPRTALNRFPMPKKLPPNFERMRYYTDLLDDAISAFPVRGSNIVKIRVRLTDAQLCLMVTNLCLKVLEERSGTVRNQSIASMEHYVDDQVVRSAEQLANSEAELTRFKESKGITALEDDSREMLKRLTEAEILYNATEAEVGSVRQRLAAVQEAIALQRKDLVPTVTSISGSSAQILRDKLIGLESQQAQLSLQKYPDDHPEAIRLRNEIEQTKKALTEEAMKIAKATDVGDPIPRIGARLEEAVSLRIELEGLEARARTLQQPVQRYRTWLDNLPEKELGLSRLERTRDANQKVYMSLLQRQEDVRIAAAKQIPGSRTIDQPLLPDQPIEPRKMLNLALGGVVGMILGFGLGFLMEARTERIGSLLEFERMTGWHVLACTPPIPGRRSWKTWFTGTPSKRRNVDPRVALIARRDPESVAGESYNMLRTRLELLGMGTKYRSLLVTSCAPSDGKSTTLSNLAATFGAFGRSTILVDAEFRRPTIHSIFGVDRAPGLADLLKSRKPSGNRSATDIGVGVVDLEPRARGLEPHIQGTDLGRVSVLAAGEEPEELAREGASWNTLREVLQELRGNFDIVLVDAPPPSMVHEALLLCGMVDAVIVVVDALSYDPQRLMETKLLLDRVGAKVLGAVLNRMESPARYAYGYGRERIPQINRPRRRSRKRALQNTP